MAEKSRSIKGPCVTSEEIIKRQAAALKETIFEAKKNETVRIRKLSEAPCREREIELKKRFEMERKHDEFMINGLLADLNRLKQGVATGEVAPRSRAGAATSRIPNEHTNRFAGCESANDLVSNYLH